MPPHGIQFVSPLAFGAAIPSSVLMPPPPAPISDAPVKKSSAMPPKPPPPIFPGIPKHEHDRQMSELRNDLITTQIELFHARNPPVSPPTPPSDLPPSDSDPTHGKAEQPPSKKRKLAAPAQPSRRSTILVYLGLSAAAGPMDIRLAYKQWLLTAHPDKGGDTQAFSVNNAFWKEVL